MLKLEKLSEFKSFKTLRSAAWKNSKVSKFFNYSLKALNLWRGGSIQKAKLLGGGDRLLLVNQKSLGGGGAAHPAIPSPAGPVAYSYMC